MASKRKNFIEESLALNKKQTPSDKIFGGVSLGVGALALFLLAIVFVLYLSLSYAVIVETPVYLYAWLLVFYPILALTIAGLYFSIGQIMRNPYLSTILGAILNGAALIALIVTTIVQAVLYDQIFIVPFYFL